MKGRKKTAGSRGTRMFPLPSPNDYDVTQRTCPDALPDQNGRLVCFHNYEAVGWCSVDECPKRLKVKVPIEKAAGEEQLLDKIWTLFVHRDDCYAVQQPDGTYRLIDQALTRELIAKHLNGELTIGVYQINPRDNSVKWAACDLDLGKLPTDEGFQILRKQAVKIVQVLMKKIPVNSLLVEFSGFKGYHIWVFFLDAVPAIVANRLLRNVVKEAEVQVNEIFPKQDELTGKGYGNLMKLPLGVHKVSGLRSEIYDGQTWNPLDPNYLLKIEPLITDPKEIASIRDKIKREESRWMEKAYGLGQPYLGDDPPCVKSYLRGGLSIGERDPVGIQLAAYLLNFRDMKETPEKQQQALEILMEWNERNSPPHSVEKVKRDMFNQALAGKYNFGCDHPNGVWKKRCMLAECSIRKNMLPILLGEFTEEALEKAKQFLMDPLGFLQHLQRCLEYRLTGELANRLFTFLVAAGARVKTSIIRLYGPNAAGKRMLYYWLPEFFGEDNVVILSSQTAAWLKRKVLEGFDTRNKIIVLTEERGDVAGQTKYTFEMIHSEDKIKIGFNIRGESGEWQPIEVELQGPLCYITSSTEIEESLHGKTREWEVNPDESKTQTERVNLWYQWRKLIPPSVEEEEKKDIEVVRAYLSLLKDYKRYAVPFISEIEFPAKALEDRRRFPEFINLMEYATYLFQHACPSHEGKSIAFAAPLLFDFINIISKDVVAVSRGSLNKGEWKLLKWIQPRKAELLSLTREGKKPSLIHTLKEGDLAEQPEAFTVREIVDHRDYDQLELGSRRTVTEKLKALANKGWLTTFASGGQGKIAVYGFRGEKLETPKMGLIRLKQPISDDFLNLVTLHLLEGVPPTSVPNRDVAKSQGCQSEEILFQPPWHGIDQLEPTIGLKKKLKALEAEEKEAAADG